MKNFGLVLSIKLYAPGEELPPAVKERMVKMTRAYEFVESLMVHTNRCDLKSYNNALMFFEFSPQFCEIPILAGYVVRARNNTIKRVLTSPIIIVRVELQEGNVYSLTWSVGFEGAEIEVEGFSLAEKLYNLNEIENMVLWVTTMNLQNLPWDEAVKAVKKSFKR